MNYFLANTTAGDKFAAEKHNDALAEYGPLNGADRVGDLCHDNYHVSFIYDDADDAIRWIEEHFVGSSGNLARHDGDAFEIISEGSPEWWDVAAERGMCCKICNTWFDSGEPEPHDCREEEG